MLNLKVKEGEYFMIGDDIRIYVQQQKGLGNRVQLAIDAPRSVPVVRGGLYERQLLENGKGV